MAAGNKASYKKRVSSGAKRQGGGHGAQAYIHGSAAPKMEPSQSRQVKKTDRDDRARQERRQKINYQVRRNQQKALRIDLPYLVMLVAASCCTLLICINYLQVQTIMTRRMDRIEKLEKDLDSLKAENDTLQTRINTSIDLDHIYQVATEELGMVYAGKNQVRMYHQTESEFVRQYEDIPTY